MFSSTVGTLYAAGTTGTIAGTITDSKTGSPVNNVTVNAVSPTGTYKATTDPKGFFSLEGVTPDTYTVSFQLTGYEPYAITGVTVSADSTADVTSKVNKSLSTIGRVSVRSQGGAFQPKNAQDTYTVTTQQINTLLGKADATSESNLLTRLPGASLDRYGYPVLRGGRENEEGFEYDGIPYVDAFTAQFTNALTLNPSLSQLQLTPGAGDVSVGGAGTGSINLVAKRGTYPGFGSIDAETLLNPFNHQFSAEYGFASPNGRVSNYISFLGTNQAYLQAGEYGTSATSVSQGVYFDPAIETSRDIVDNFVLKFGRNNNQSFQILVDNQQSNFIGQYGGYGNTGYPTADPFIIASYLKPFTGLTTAQLQSPSLVPLLPFQTSLSETFAQGNKGGENAYEPNNTLKFQYSNNLSSSSFITAKFYSLDSVTSFDYPNESEAGLFGSQYALQGGHRDGGTIDFTTQAGSKHVLSAGAEYDFLKPTYDSTDTLDALAITGAAGSNFEIGDFVSPTAANCPNANFGLATTCGYLYNYLTNPGTVPYDSEVASDVRQDYSFYLRDKFSPTDKTVIDYGVRMEGSNVHFPGVESGCNPTVAQVAAGTVLDNCMYAASGFTNQTLAGTSYSVPFVNIPNEDKKPFEFEPRLAISQQLTKNDAIRLSYGRTVEFAPLAFEDVETANVFGKYTKIPSFSGATGAAAVTCGVSGTLTCQNYGDQLFWEYANNIQGVPQQPVKPETFNNYEASFSHQFGDGIGVKVTPFYRRGYDALALVATPKIVNGQTVVNPSTGNPALNPSVTTNLGQSRTTGVEFYLTREAAYGLSGTLSATYINEFTNVIPSPLIQEDFFPPIPTASLALGNQYRVSFVSPFSASVALSYKMHNGLKFNPIVSYTRGYPAGVGNLSAAFVNGKAYNITNTNAANSATFGAQNYAPNYIDPANPGTLFNPNIAATRGTTETASAGGFVTNPRVNTNLGIEFSPPTSHNTFGVLISNLFNQVYSQVPTYNARYQPVATGISGPKTGQSATPFAYPNEGFGPYPTAEFGQDPYRINYGSNSQLTAPTTYRLYYQLAL